MMILQGSICYLRDPMLNDMKEFEQWYQPNQEWMQWDAPWQSYKPIDFLVLRQHLERQISLRHSGQLRQRLELSTNDHIHIGWLSWYYIENHQDFMAIGIDIVPPEYRSNGYGKEAYVLFMQYLLASGVPTLYTQTWSGNERMIKLAQSTCFREYYRRHQIFQVGGNLYDEVTFQLDVPSFHQTYGNKSVHFED